MIGYKLLLRASSGKIGISEKVSAEQRVGLTVQELAVDLQAIALGREELDRGIIRGLMVEKESARFRPRSSAPKLFRLSPLALFIARGCRRHPCTHLDVIVAPCHHPA